MAEREKYLNYFDEFAVEDQEDVITICETASKIIWDRFRARFDDPRLLATTFSHIYTAIKNKLKSLEAEYSDFKLNIAGRLEMGYTTNENEDDEKQGNFMVFIRHLNSNKKNDELDDPTLKAVERAVQWNTENIIDQPKLLTAISVDALELLKTVDINIGSSELIMPIFVTTYESIINYIKIKRREENDFEYEVNFISCFYIGARETEDDIDDIYIRPNIEAKLEIKDDSKASSQYE